MSFWSKNHDVKNYLKAKLNIDDAISEISTWKIRATLLDTDIIFAQSRVFDSDLRFCC